MLAYLHKRYRVKTLYLYGKRSKQFKSGDIVTASDFKAGSIDYLVEKKYLEPIDDTNKNFETGEYDLQNTRGALKIVITTMVWKRWEIFEMWADGVKNIISYFNNVDIKVVIAGSEGNESRKRVEKHCFHYIEHPNMPLSNKANARLSACKQFNPDYVVLVGSDDIISIKAFDFILSKMAKGYDEIAPMDIYYFDTVSQTAAYSHGYQNRRKGEPVAVGRALSKYVLNKCNWNLWPQNIPCSLDRFSKKRINQFKRNHFYYRCKDEGIVICDIKSKTNITKFALRPNYEIINKSIISNQIPQIK
jgi:hypothetical protein